MPDSQTPSFLESESRGGDTAEGGFSFQSNVIVACIPKWLSLEGFSGIVREAIGDAEAKIFAPGYGARNELIEVKNHTITPREFWDEIQRFQAIDAGSPGTYQWFTLAAPEVSKSLHPMINGLRRVRDPYGFYEPGSGVLYNSFEAYKHLVMRFSQSIDLAHFLFEKVLISTELGTLQAHGEALFRQNFITSLPEYRDVPNGIITTIFSTLNTFLQNQKNVPISRQELEQKIREQIPTSQIPPIQPIRIFTANEPDSCDNKPDLCFSWADFSGSNGQEYPPQEDWDLRIIGELQETKRWISKHRNYKRLKLTGNRRTSAALALGYVFSPKEGFAIDMQHQNNTWWATDQHASEDDKLIVRDTLKVNLKGDNGERLIVSISVLRDTMDSDVEAYVQTTNLANMPILHVKWNQAVISPQQANAIAWEIKLIISDALSFTNAKTIDLFSAMPSFLAVFLGHRLSAVAPIQCYELVSPKYYVPTSFLA